MKNFFKNMKNYKFWINFSAALIIFLNALSKPLGIEIDNQVVEDVILGFAGVLVVLGLVNKSGKEEDKKSDSHVVDGENTPQEKTENGDETEDNIDKNNWIKMR